MRGHVGPAPPSTARTFAFALASGLLVVGLALEVAVATVNERPVNLPVGCAGSTPHADTGAECPDGSTGR